MKYIFCLVIIIAFGCVRPPKNNLEYALNSRNKNAIYVASEIIKDHDGTGTLTINFDADYKTSKYALDCYLQYYLSVSDSEKHKMELLYNEKLKIFSPIWIEEYWK